MERGIRKLKNRYMKLKQIHDFLKSIVVSLVIRRDSFVKQKASKDSLEYAEGQLYEAQYILDVFERVLYENEKLVTDKDI